jgi:limonene 1,2-monooxygenase
MQFGIFSNARRPKRATWAEWWDEDLKEIAAADELGFDEAWISEHDSPAELIICKAAGMTKRIQLGSAVRPLAYHHPLQVAIEGAACDNLTHGRYKLGIGFGFYAAHMERRGLDFSKARDMMHASTDLILKLWTSEEPIDYDGPFWKGKQMFIKPRPIQNPHPPCAVAVNNTPSTVDLAAKHGFQVLTSDFISPERLMGFLKVHDEANTKYGRGSQRNKFSVCRVVYVAETDKQARDELRDSYNDVIKWEVANTPHHQIERVPPGGTMADIKFDELVDRGNLIVGSPDTVAKGIRELYQQLGGFGTLMIHCGRDYATPERFVRSLGLFMREVAPKLRALDPDAMRAAA